MTTSFSGALDWAREQVRSGTLPSVVVGASSGGGAQMLESFGSSAERQVRPDDYFELYSVSKPLVGLAAMRAVEAGGLSLAHPLGSALSGASRDHGDTVRLEHLLSHTSGIKDIALDDPTELRQALRSAILEFTPGTMTSYSNLAFEGVAAMLERFTGSDVYEHVAELNSPEFPEGITFDYDVDPHPVHGAEGFGLDVEVLRGHRHPAAGAYGTAPALLELGSRVLGSLRGDSADLIRSESLHEMLLPRTTGLEDPHPGLERKEYGLSWNLRSATPRFAGSHSFGHAGLSGTQWWIYPELDTTFVLMTNLIDAENAGADFRELDRALCADLAESDSEPAGAVSESSDRSLASEVAP